jgi:hypothetical protein
MPVQASFGRKMSYQVFGANGELVAAEEFSSDDQAVAWVRRLVREGVAVGRLSREIMVGFAVDVPIS